jgi:hypothetical protein
MSEQSAVNPFQAPAAHVEDIRGAGDGSLLSQPNRVASGRGAGWWSSSWDLFREATGLWIGIGIAYIGLSVVLSVIPFLSIVFSVLFPVIYGGLMLGCHSLAKGEGLRFGHLFAGFQKNFGQLALAGLLYIVGIVIVILGVALLFGGLGFAAAMSGSEPSQGVAIIGIVLAVLVALALATPLMMAIWFAPALIALNDLSAVEAMKLSFRGCLRNLVPFLVYGLVAIVLAIVATIPLGLGWLALLPTMICSIYVAYREIFTAEGQ